MSVRLASLNGRLHDIIISVWYMVCVSNRAVINRASLVKDLCFGISARSRFDLASL